MVLLGVVTTLLAAVVVLLRWLTRYLRQRGERRLDPDLRDEILGLRATSRTQRVGECLVVAIGALSLGCVLWGFIEPRFPQVTEHHVVSNRLHPGTHIRVVQLSDLHSEATGHVESKVIQRVAALKPDLIVFTGDAINEEAGLPIFRATMTALARIAPCYAVRGNWETWWFPNLDLYGGTGVVPLDGRAKSIMVRGQELWLVGVGVDRESEFPHAMSQVKRDAFTVLLHHFPALAPRAAKLGIDLMLAGDTHGGQVKLPLFGELVRITRRNFWRSNGMHREGSMWLYVNRGIGGEGGIPLFRFACRPEIALFVLARS
ncbi:MAG TPA: metallophosphoesterase [Polyangiaceae bacterium]